MAQGRPGPARSETARRAVLQSASRLLEDGGFEAVTIEGIARDAGVGKQTIYRWYPSKSAIIADALMEGVLDIGDFPVADTGDVVADLSEWLAALFTFLQDETHVRLLESLLIAAVNDRSIAEQTSSRLGGTQPAVMARLTAAEAADVLPPGSSPALIGEAIFGVVVLRAINRQPFDPDDARAIVAMVLGSPGRAASG